MKLKISSHLGELSFAADAFLFVIHKDDDGWWEGSVNGQIGIFPNNYVKVRSTVF